MRLFLLFGIIVFASTAAFPQAIRSAVYPTHSATDARKAEYDEQTLFEGTTRDYSHLIVQAITLPANWPGQPGQQLDEEAILIIKTGELSLTVGSKHKTLGPGSVAMIMPGDDFRVENKAAQPLTYYLMRYTSNEMPDLDLYRLIGSSFWVDWQETGNTADSSGQRLVTGATIMSNRLAIQLTTLGPGLAKDTLQSHRAAELLIVLDHPVQVRIDGVQKEANVGDLIFVESELPHSLQTSAQTGSTCLSLQF